MCKYMSGFGWGGGARIAMCEEKVWENNEAF